MSEARSTYVSIVLKDEATKQLQKIDKLVGEVERSFMGFGQKVDDSTDGFNSLTSEIRRTNREIENTADETESLARMLVRSEQNAQGLYRTTAQLETELQASRQEVHSLASRLSAAETEMRNLREEANRVDTSLQSANNSASNLSGIIAGVGAGAAITGIVATVSEFESSMGRIEAKTTLTGAELQAVQNSVSAIYTDGIGTDLRTVTDEVTRMKMSLQGLEGEELTSFGTQAITVADLMNESTDTITWAVKTMTSNFDNLSEHQALDLITVAFKRTGDYSQDLLDTFKEYSPYFSKMGLDAEEFTKILIAGAESGAWNMDNVADSVKEFGILGTDGSKSTAEGFAAIGLDADMMAKQIAKGGDSANQAFYATIAALSAMDDEVARNHAGIALFGTKWEDVREDVILAMGDAKNAVLDFDGAAAKATDAATDNFGTDLLSTVREFKTEVAKMFSNGTGAEALASGLSLVETGLEGALVGLQWLIDHKDTIVAVGSGLATGFAVFKGAEMAKGIFDVVKGFSLVGNPIGIAAVAIGGLVTAGIGLYKNWDTITEAWHTFTGDLKTTGSAVLDFFSTSWDNIKLGFSTMTTEVGGLLGQVGGFFVGLKDKAVGLWETIKENPMLLSVVGPIGTVIGAGMTLYQNWDTIKGKAGELWATTVEKFNGIKQSVSNFVQPAIQWFGSLGGKWDALKTKLGELWTATTEKFALIKESVSNFVQPAISWFDNLSGKWNDFKTAISNFKMPEWMSNVGGAISSGISKVKSWVGADGSHATGLASVPYDGYRAELHGGEAVLTAAQSDTLRSTGILRENSDGTPNIDLSPMAIPVNAETNYTPSMPTVSVTTNTTGGSSGNRAPINVVNHFTIHAQGNDADAILTKIKSVVPSMIRATISDIIDEELQTQ